MGDGERVVVLGEDVVVAKDENQNRVVVLGEDVLVLPDSDSDREVTERVAREKEEARQRARTQRRMARGTSHDGDPRGFIQDYRMLGRDAVNTELVASAGGGEITRSGNISSFIQEGQYAGRDMIVFPAEEEAATPPPPPPPPPTGDQVLIGYQFQADGGSIDVTSENATAQDPAMGVAPFSYEWEEVIPVSTDDEYTWWSARISSPIPGTITPNAPSSKVTNFHWVATHNGPWDAAWIYRCKITDSNSTVFYTSRFLIAMTSSITHSAEVTLDVPSVTGVGNTSATSYPVTASEVGSMIPAVWQLNGWLGHTTNLVADNPINFMEPFMTTFSAVLDVSPPSQIVGAYYCRIATPDGRMGYSPPVKIKLDYS